MTSKEVTKIEMVFKDPALGLMDLYQAVAAGNKVKIPGLGIFEMKRRAGHGKRVLQGKEIEVKDFNWLEFRPTRKFKSIIKEV